MSVDQLFYKSGILGLAVYLVIQLEKAEFCFQNPVPDKRNKSCSGVESNDSCI